VVADPFWLGLFTEFGLSGFPLYVLVVVVYACLLYNYLAAGQGGPEGMPPPGRVYAVLLACGARMQKNDYQAAPNDELFTLLENGSS
jgi:hypothetical protein